MNYRDGKPTVLVVEDDSGLLQLLVKMLASGGFDTVAAGRAADGLSLVRQRQGAFDLAIVDMVMPGMSGLDLATDLWRVPQPQDPLHIRVRRAAWPPMRFPGVPRTGYC